MRRGVVLVAIAVVTLLISGGPAFGSGGPPSFAHVFVLVGENKTYSQITASPARDPFIMNILRPESAWFTGYNSVTTGSLADYIALTSGQFAPCQRKGPCGKFDVPNIFGELSAANMTWWDWSESMPSNCYPQYAGSMTTWNYYKPGHNPSLFYSDLNVSTSSLCAAFDTPAGSTNPNDMSSFNRMLAAGTDVPDYNFVSPNGCEAGYESCYGYDGYNTAQKLNPITEYDNFLKKEIPLIQASPACTDPATGQDACLIVATLDEGGHTRGSSTMLAVTGEGVVPGTYDGYFDHYSVLKTIQDGWNLPCTANTCGSPYTDYNGTTRTAVDLPIFG